MSKPTKNRVFCPYSNKQKMVFETEKKALNHIKFNSEDYDGKVPVRAYFCQACGGWHLTSQKKKNSLMKVFIVNLMIASSHGGWDLRDALVLSVNGRKVKVLTTTNGTFREHEFDQFDNAPHYHINDLMFKELDSRISFHSYELPENLFKQVTEINERCKSHHRCWDMYDLCIISQIKAQDLRTMKVSRLGMY